MADAPDSKSGDPCGHAGSSPASGIQRRFHVARYMFYVTEKNEYCYEVRGGPGKGWSADLSVEDEAGALEIGECIYAEAVVVGCENPYPEAVLEDAKLLQGFHFF